MRGVLYSRKDRPREYCKNKTLANNSMVLLNHYGIFLHKRLKHS